VHDAFEQILRTFARASACSSFASGTPLECAITGPSGMMKSSAVGARLCSDIIGVGMFAFIALMPLLGGDDGRTFQRAMGELIDRLHAASEFRVLDSKCSMTDCSVSMICRDGSDAKLHLHQTAPRITEVVLENTACAADIWKQLDLLTTRSRSAPLPSWMDETTGVGWRAAAFGGYTASEDSTLWFTNGPRIGGWKATALDGGVSVGLRAEALSRAHPVVRLMTDFTYVSRSSDSVSLTYSVLALALGIRVPLLRSRNRMEAVSAFAAVGVAGLVGWMTWQPESIWSHSIYGIAPDLRGGVDVTLSPQLSLLFELRWLYAKPLGTDDSGLSAGASLHAPQVAMGVAWRFR
jgi:hypothetical protein